MLTREREGMIEFTVGLFWVVIINVMIQNSFKSRS